MRGLVRVIAWRGIVLLLSSAVAAQDQTCTGSTTDESCLNTSEKEPCTDDHEQCHLWASSGECEGNPYFMLPSCRKACDICKLQAEGLSIDQIILNKVNIDSTWGPKQSLPPDNEEMIANTLKVIGNTRHYMLETVYKSPEYAKVRDICKNEVQECAWASAMGQCIQNPAVMNIKCAPACMTCQLLDFETRCPIDRTEKQVFDKAGDLNHMFERIVADDDLSVAIHSMPEPYNETFQDGPWVVVLENFLNQEECEKLIDLGAAEGYQGSKQVGAKRADGGVDEREGSGRTSSQSWCARDECNKHPTTIRLQERMERLTGIPEPNHEFLQMLQYEVGQSYGIHHDYIEYHGDRQQGVRIMTILLYLNDVEEGGGTNFPLLNNLTVLPKRGRALLWASVLNDDPTAKDDRTTHQAFPVTKGIKYAANAWLHQRGFKEVVHRNCHH